MKAHGLWVDDRPLQVNHAEFGKEKGIDKDGKIPVHRQVQRPVANVVQAGVIRDGARGIRDRRSYAEAVEGKRIGEIGNILLKAEEAGNGWLFESIIVRLKAQFADASLKKELAAIGVEDIMVRESGGRDVVITFKSKEERALKLPAIKELITDWCEDITEGQSGQVLEQERCVENVTCWRSVGEAQNVRSDGGKEMSDELCKETLEVRSQRTSSEEETV
ncbi:unnamed protein product [Camellia sinensis]